MKIKAIPNLIYTAWKVSKYRVISGPYFPVFGLNTGKYGPEITPYLVTFHASTHLLYQFLLRFNEYDLRDIVSHRL